MSHELILGIDGGGSKVLVTLADKDGRILRTALGGGVNPMDNPDWRQELERHIEPFRSDPGLAAVGAALPAYGEVAHLSSFQKRCIDEAFPDIRRTVLNDVDAAHLGAFAGRPGILVLSGTGSMSWARNGTGASARVGGWGDVIGDEGSSYWIGREALHLISQSLDGRTRPTALATVVYEHLELDISDPINALSGWISGLARPRAGIAALSVLVDQVASNGDEAAIGLIERAAEELAKHHWAISGHCETSTDWTYAGGTFSSRLLLEAVERRIGRRAVSPVLPPIGGALLAAAQLLDWQLDERWFGQIAIAAEAVIARSRQ